MGEESGRLLYCSGGCHPCDAQPAIWKVYPLFYGGAADFDHHSPFAESVKFGQHHECTVQTGTFGIRIFKLPLGEGIRRVCRQ